MKHVIGIDLGTSAVKVLLVNNIGEVVFETSESYPLIQEQSGYSEQNPLDWLDKTTIALKRLTQESGVDKNDIEGISFSGQMHGLVLLDKNGHVLRNAILWNDTRTSAECEDINNIIGKELLFEETKNMALEGFTLPKLLWVKKHEPEIYNKIDKILLPKDYVRFMMTDMCHMDLSDAAGTLLLNVTDKEWSETICSKLEINTDILPKLVDSYFKVGTLTASFANKVGLSSQTRVFAGGADNACGAIGAGILSEGDTLCSIGTSGVILNYGSEINTIEDNMHYFNHAIPNEYYSMGVTLSAGHSLSWLHQLLRPNESIESLLEGIENIPIGSNGLIFTPYLVGERTPHSDALIRASFIGLDTSHNVRHIARAVLEGITFSLNESIVSLRRNNKVINSIISIGGGAKNPTWLQIQADIFNINIKKLTTEQGPGMGAAMIAAVGCNWFKDTQECAKLFLKVSETYEPIPENVEKYSELFSIYKRVYPQTSKLNNQLSKFRN